jgi:urea transport system ATP-binding protein
MNAATVTQSPQVTQSLLYLNGVSVTFDGFRAINNLSLELAPGEMRAIIGPNGAGKTTMMDIITGKTRPDAGDVLFDRGAIDLTTKDESSIAQLGIGRKFQKPTVFENHTVEDNAALSLKSDRSVLRNLMWDAAAKDGERVGKILGTIGLGGHRIAGRIAVARPEAVARDRHADRAGPGCWSKSRWPA